MGYVYNGNNFMFSDITQWLEIDYASCQEATSIDYQIGQKMANTFFLWMKKATVLKIQWQ
jgi:hypothetical protein